MYPSVEGPYGLSAVGTMSGVGKFNTQHYPVASGYGTAIFNGDVVTMVAAGTVEKETNAATGASPLGVFIGCTYTDPVSGSPTFSAYYPGGVAADDIMAVVINDPTMVFKVAVVSSGTTISGVSRADSVGSNAPLEQNAGNTVNGFSRVALDGGSIAVTAGLPLRIIDGVEETKDSSGNYTELLVKFNGHQLDAGAGI